MASLTIRNLDERLKTRLRVRAASLGRSMEEEARNILRAALEEVQPPTSDLAERIRRRFADLGDIELRIAPREPVREPTVPDAARKAHSGSVKRGVAKHKRRA